MATSNLPKLLAQHQANLLTEWTQAQRDLFGAGTVTAEHGEQSRRFVAALQQGAQTGELADINTAVWGPAREALEDVSRARALAGGSPSETASVVLSFKGPLFDLLRRESGKDAEKLAHEIWTATGLIDKLALLTTEIFQKSREDVIRRQQEDMLEMSTPVVQLWKGILALPLIGTLDSARTQIVMENLLQEIVKTEAEIAIIDITGVPTVDTLVAQHLLKTVSAARLMGADCIISGIRPQIAQTLVHLGVELNVISKATMADAFALALRRTNRAVVDRGKSSSSRTQDAPSAVTE